MVKSRKKLKVSPEMAAEDAYRWQWCLDNGIKTDQMCYWFPHIQSSKFPVEKKKDNKYKTRYNAHTMTLNEAFGDHDDTTILFELQITDTMGLGVFARRDLPIVRGDAADHFTTRLLQAQYQNVIQGVAWSNRTVTTLNNIGGRPRKDTTTNTCSNTVNKSMKQEGVLRSMVGPLDFLNHACDKHAQFQVEENVEQERLSVKPKLNTTIIRKGDQLFINYMEGNIASTVHVVFDYCCLSCQEKEEKEEEGLDNNNTVVVDNNNNNSNSNNAVNNTARNTIIRVKKEEEGDDEKDCDGGIKTEEVPSSSSSSTVVVNSAIDTVCVKEEEEEGELYSSIIDNTLVWGDGTRTGGVACVDQQQQQQQQANATTTATTDGRSSIPDVTTSSSGGRSSIISERKRKERDDDTHDNNN